MLTPASDDTNRLAEGKRQKEDPSSFGAPIPLAESLRNMSGSGLSGQITIETIKKNKESK